MHEFVLSGTIQKARGASTAHIAKRMLDYGVHAPTVYFPLLVPEAMMIEPTETESKETLDEFIEIMQKIDYETKTNPEIVTTAPHSTPVGKLDEALAAVNQIFAGSRTNSQRYWPAWCVCFQAAQSCSCFLALFVEIRSLVERKQSLFKRGLCPRLDQLVRALHF